MGNTVPVYTNATGGKQSDIPYRFDLLPPLSLAKVAQILDQGAKKYGENNWHKIPVNENLNHALAHIISYLAGDNQEDHLRNALCRVFFASEVELMNVNPKDLSVDDMCANCGHKRALHFEFKCPDYENLSRWEPKNDNAIR